MKIAERIFSNNYFIIIVVYTISYGLIIFNKSIYWDRWALYHQYQETLISIYQDNGHIWLDIFCII